MIGCKWWFVVVEKLEKIYVICNVDEGELGIFKDWVLLIEWLYLFFEGMIIVVKVVNVCEGILYLCGEYVYLWDYLLEVLEECCSKGFFGREILGDSCFFFDICIQMGVGVYICGEEGVFISFCEGLLGELKIWLLFLVNCGYFGYLIVVNNVEIFCYVVCILDKGVKWFYDMGIVGSYGMKLFLVCGDCFNFGIYELFYGYIMWEFLEWVGGEDVVVVQVGGLSGIMIFCDSFYCLLIFDDLVIGGVIIIFNGDCNILEIVEYYMLFFVYESCGYCMFCCVGNVFLQKVIQKFFKGLVNLEDIDYLKDLFGIIIEISCCGFGMMLLNLIFLILENFLLVYLVMIKFSKDGICDIFDIQFVIDGVCKIVKC